MPFLDIQKAYDKVWREGLWYKLFKYGIRGKLWRVLRKIYKKVESCVVIDEQWTDFFEIELGLRQGCLLSPILFALFINDLVDEIQKLNLGIQCGLKKISLLLFADDIVVIAESRKDLEKMLAVIYEYSLKWRFKFNYDKCAMVIFGNKEFPNVQYGKCDSNSNCGFHVQFGPNLIKEVGIYKYLGVELDKNYPSRILKRDY